MSERYIQSEAVRLYIGHEAITDPLPVIHCLESVTVDSERLGGGQRIETSFASPVAPKGVIIYPTAWSDYGSRPFQEVRIGALARFTGARVIHLDWPGMGASAEVYKTSLSEKQEEELVRGRATNLAEVYWKVAESHDLLTDDNRAPLPLGFMMHSMANLVGTEMAATAPYRVADYHSSEALGLTRRAPALLGLSFALKANRHFNDYAPMNEGLDLPDSGIGPMLKRALTSQRFSHWLPVKAMARGSQLDVFEEAIQSGRFSFDSDHGTRFHAVTAEDGLVSRTAALLQLQSMRNGVTSGNGDYPNARGERLIGEGHGYQDSLPAFLDQASRLAIYDGAF